MPTAILNVPLHFIADIKDLEQRHRMVMACMRLCFHDVVGELRPQQGAAWSVITVGVEASHRVFEEAVSYLARQIGCDFISILYEDGSGASVPAGAAAFDRGAFILPSICNLRSEAA